VAATSARRFFARFFGRSFARVAGLLGGVLAGGAADAADLPQDEAEAMYHLYDGGGVIAQGPALLVRKSIADTVSLSATYFADIVSNASIDVVTQASKFKETRNEGGVGAQYVYRDSLLSISTTRSKEPDYTATGLNLDASQDVFGGLTTVSIGFSRGWDTVLKHNDSGFSQAANHWQYRLGLTQILTPRWIASANLEAISDQGYLQSPYRAARVFGALVPENDPNTRTSRALTLRAVGDVGSGSRSAVRAEYRYFWDTWDIKASTLELGYSRYISDRWLVDGYGRYYTQTRALFYSDNATTESLYVSRNRQLGTYHDAALGAKVSYSAIRVPAKYEIKVNGALEVMKFNYEDYTDIRTGNLYSFTAGVVELTVSATF
jgi:hypothetical protein